MNVYQIPTLISGEESFKRSCIHSKLDWKSQKAELKADLIILLAEYGYPPVDRDEVYKEIFEQAENFKKYQSERKGRDWGTTY